MVVSSEGVSAQTFGFAKSPKRRQWLWRYGPLAVWLALIFIGSTDLLSASNTGGVLARPVLWLFPHASEATVRAVQFLGRKAGHFTEYAILGVLAARAFRTSAQDLLRRRWFWISLLLVVVYSLSDEFHQSFVPSRTGSIYDSIIDSIGGLIALTILRWRGRRPNRQDRNLDSNPAP